MSTYIYLTCESHNPPLRAEDESGQHLYDLPRIREEIQNRKVIARIEDEGLPCGNPFVQHSAYFLSRHKECGIGIVDEYGQTYPIEPEPEWVNNAPAVRAWHKNDGHTEHNGKPGLKRIWSPDYGTSATWSTPSLRNVPWSDLVNVEPLGIIEDVK